jgi:adenylate cyclase
MGPCRPAHRGRIVKTTGDGLLVEFASAVDAVRCAVEVQRDMTGQNTDLSQDARIEFQCQRSSPSRPGRDASRASS